MSLPIFRLRDGTTIPARPVGKMLKGWIPGTIVNFVQTTEEDTKYLSVDYASEYPNKIGAAGFTINGSSFLKSNFDFRFANNNEKNGYWTADENVQLSKSEENFGLEFDASTKQLSLEGKNLTTINFDGGIFRIYTFEKYDNEYLNGNGETGGEIDWKSKVGTLLGCSPRSLFTSFDNNVLSELYEYRVGGFYKDENGKEYIYAVRR